MAAVLVVVADVQAHEPDEMPFAEDDDVFEHLSAAATQSSAQRFHFAKDCDMRCELRIPGKVNTDSSAR